MGADRHLAVVLCESNDSGVLCWRRGAENEGIYSKDTYLTLRWLGFSSCAMAGRGQWQCVVVDWSECNVIDCWWRVMGSLRYRVDSNTTKIRCWLAMDVRFGQLCANQLVS